MSASNELAASYGTSTPVVRRVCRGWSQKSPDLRFRTLPSRMEGYGPVSRRSDKQANLPQDVQREPQADASAGTGAGGGSVALPSALQHGPGAADHLVASRARQNG